MKWIWYSIIQLMMYTPSLRRAGQYCKILFRWSSNTEEFIFRMIFSSNWWCEWSPCRPWTSGPLVSTGDPCYWWPGQEHGGQGSQPGLLFRGKLKFELLIKDKHFWTEEITNFVQNIDTLSFVLAKLMYSRSVSLKCPTLGSYTNK